eukprot:TRINITY_DN1492_c3_g1_i1.p1 TRINITY_DN1492_c3_g1~~TRINITY_DN1492_c3_g1_i1.p1  ORF type:complete len:388 (+),score=54.57 TRINITY_DN1492_c3_g1_i1:162-1166(+)
MELLQKQCPEAVEKLTKMGDTCFTTQAKAAPTNVDFKDKYFILKEKFDNLQIRLGRKEADKVKNTEPTSIRNNVDLVSGLAGIVLGVLVTYGRQYIMGRRTAKPLPYTVQKPLDELFDKLESVKIEYTRKNLYYWFQISTGLLILGTCWICARQVASQSRGGVFNALAGYLFGDIVGTGYMIIFLACLSSFGFVGAGFHMFLLGVYNLLKQKSIKGAIESASSRLRRTEKYYARSKDPKMPDDNAEQIRNDLEAELLEERKQLDYEYHYWIEDGAKEGASDLNSLRLARVGLREIFGSKKIEAATPAKSITNHPPPSIGESSPATLMASPGQEA